jgi:hypothetical protein
MGIMLKNYKRLVYIDTGATEQEKYRNYARKVADQFNLRFEEMPGSNELIEKMMTQQWDTDFVVAQPGETITYADFRTTTKTAANLNLYQTGPAT